MENENPSAGQSESTWFSFSGPTFPPVHQDQISPIGVTCNNHLASLLFEQLLVDLQGTDKPLCAVTMTSLELRAELLSKDSFVGYISDFRGSCKRSSGARATLIAELGGSTFTKEFPYGDTSDQGESWSGRIFSFEQRGSSETNPGTPPLPPFTVNIIIVAQRLSQNDSVLFTLDSLDLTAQRG